MKILKGLFIGVGVLVVLAVVAGGAGFLYVQNANHKHLVESLIEKKAGMKAEVENISLVLLPNVVLKADALKIHPFTGEKNIFEAQNLHFEGNLMELIFQKRLRLVNVTDPTVYLHRSAKGRANWESPRKNRHDKGGSAPLGLLALLDSLNITNGDIRYIDEQAGQQYAVRQLSMNIDSETPEKKQARFQAVVNEVPVSVDGRFRVSSFSGNVPLETTLHLAENKLSLNGTLLGVTDKQPGFSGKVGLDGPTLVPTLRRFGLIQPAMQIPAEPIVFGADARLDGKVTTLNGMVLKVGESVLSGDVTVTKGRKQMVEAALTMSALDMNKLGQCGKGESTQKGASSKSTPWSSNVVDLSSLHQMDFDITFKTDRFTCGAHTLKAVNLAANNKNGHLTLNDFSFAGPRSGTGKVVGELVASQPARGEFKMTLEKLPVEDFVGNDKLALALDGQGHINFQGRSTQDWANSLNGDLSFRAEDGKVGGIKASKANQLTKFFGGLFGDEGEAQSFSLFDASYTIEKGVARTEKFVLQGPKINLKGEGKINLAGWTINNKFTPSIKVAGVSLPILVRGNLYSPTIVPDMASAQGVATGLGTLVGGPAGAAVGNMLGTMLDGGAEKILPASEGEGGENLPFDLNNKDDLEKNVKNFFGGLLKKQE